MEQPCPRDCPDRKPGCGANCEKWQQYVAARNAAYEARLRSLDFETCKQTVIGRAEHTRWLKRRK